MRTKNKLNLGVALCLAVAAIGLVFSYAKKHRQISKANTSQTIPELNESEVNDPDVLGTSVTAPLLPVPTGKNVRIPILMYHHIGIPDPKDSMPDLFVSPTDFESQLKYFKDQGYETITMQLAYDSLVSGMPLPPKPIIFTFDDGYKDNFTNAVPILQKYGDIGTFAIATELLGRPGYGVWGDVLGAHNQGMEIVSHTENHLDLASQVYSEADLRREIFGSKKILEDKLGVSVNFFVYPYGKYNDKVMALVKEAGYKIGLTTAFGFYINDKTLLATPRVRVHGTGGLEKLKKIFEPPAVSPAGLVDRKSRTGSGQTNP